jgi:ABC-type multidrug transport system ATPase subunit
MDERLGLYLVWYASFYGGLQQPAADLLRLVGPGDSGGRPIGQFSRGMQQRLALARGAGRRCRAADPRRADQWAGPARAAGDS